MIAATTDLAAALPRRVAEKLTEGLPLCIARLPTPPMQLTLQLVWHSRTHEHEGATYFRHLITRTLAAH